ncbi:hypothetical protein GMSM_29690 [Geomonas sp. Red276]
MYGREPNDFTADIQLSDQDILDLRLLIASQRKRLVRLSLEIRRMGECREGKRANLLDQLHRERVALEDMEYAHIVAVKNNTKYMDTQCQYSIELEELYFEDLERINAKIAALKAQDEPEFLLVRIRNMLADFMGQVELRMISEDRQKRYMSGKGIAGSKVDDRCMDLTKARLS